MYIKKGNKYIKISDNKVFKKDNINDNNEDNKNKEFKIAENILNKFKEKGIKPLPENYEKEFEFLVTINDEYEEIKELLKIKEFEFFQADIEEEKIFIELLKNNITTLKTIKDLYSFLIKENTIISNILDNIEITNKEIYQLKKEYNKYAKKLKKLLKNVKNNYDKNYTVIKKVKDMNITKYDHRYNLYNKQYFFKKIENKKGVMIKIYTSFNKELKKDYNLIIKKIGNSILKELRKNDLITFDNNSFSIFIEDINKELAKKILERITNKINSLYLISSGEEINVNLKTEIIEYK